MLLRQRGPGRERLVWSVRSPALPTPAADPRVVGGTLRVVGFNQEVVVSLAPAGWDLRRDGTLQFLNRLAPSGLSPVQSIALRAGSKLGLRAKATGITLDDPQQGSVSLFLTIGDDVYCSRCSNPRVDVPGHFAARRCPAPASCSPTTTSTVTSTTATSTATTMPGTTSSSTTTTTLCSLVVQWGSPGSGPGQFNSPVGIATNVDGSRVFVADTANGRVQIFDQDGAFVSALSGSVDGAFLTAYDVDVDSGGNVFVPDVGNNRIVKFDPDGNFLTAWGRLGAADGEFISPIGIATDPQGNVYVADEGNHRIQVFDGSGAFLRTWGSFGPGVGQFEYPNNVAVYDSSDVYVSEVFGSRISRFTLLGGIPNGVVSLSIATQVNTVAADASGHVYFATGASVMRIDDPGLTGVQQSAWSDGVNGLVFGVATAPGNVVYGTDSLRNFVQKRVCPP